MMVCSRTAAWGKGLGGAAGAGSDDVVGSGPEGAPEGASGVSTKAEGEGEGARLPAEGKRFTVGGKPTSATTSSERRGKLNKTIAHVEEKDGGPVAVMRAD
jgi:hypothetical protein